MVTKSETSIKLADCLNADSVNKLSKAYGEQNVEMAVFSVVFEYMDLFNVKFHMSDVQKKFFAEGFIEEFGHETIDDLIVCLKSAAKGKFGDIYNSIDPPLLFKWFRLHLDTKYQEKEKQLQRKKITMLKQSEESPVNQQLNQEFCKKIRMEMKEKEVKRKKRNYDNRN